MANRKILIIDDEKGLTDTMRLLLEERGGYHIRVENNGARGLQAAREFHPDIILLDIIMPDVSGTEVARQIRNHDETKDIPIAFLTAVLINEKDPSPEFPIDGYPYIAKPVGSQELVQFIEKVMEKG